MSREWVFACMAAPGSAARQALLLAQSIRRLAGNMASSDIYRIFIHQAILSATILARCEPDVLQQLPQRINYPLPMHKIYPADRRAVTMNELITCRYDTLFEDADWHDATIIEEPLRSWLREHL